MRAPFRAALLLALALGAAGVALADRETALFSSTRADKALAAKKWDEAESLYRKSLEEDETFLPARYGLVQALVGEGRTAVAVEELRRFTEDARAAAATLPADWKPLVAKAEKQLADLDAAGAAFQKIQDGYADALADYAQRWLTKDPTNAERALRRALKLKPGHPKAVALLEKTPHGGSETTELFDGKSAAGWTGMDAPMWTIDDGQIVGVVQAGAYIVRSLKEYTGDFTVRVEAKVLDEYAQPVLFAFHTCVKGDHDYYSIGVLRGKVTWSDEQGPNKGRDVAVKSPPEFTKQTYDARQWNTYEVRHQAGTVTVLVNGEELGHEERPEWRKGGFVGLRVQDVKVAFRKVQVEMK